MRSLMIMLLMYVDGLQHKSWKRANQALPKGDKTDLSAPLKLTN